MKVSDLLAGYGHQVFHGDPETTEVRAGIAYDSRRMTRGSMYIAMRGTRTDGHQFVQDAIDRGAVALLVDRPIAAVPAHVCVVQVPDTRAAAPSVACRYFGQPGREMDIVAVTGTNGKTSVSYMIESVLRSASATRVGVIGTDGCRIGDEPIRVDKTTPTTPEAVDLQHIMRLMRDRGTATIVMEASSTALLARRVDCAHIDVGIFTNLTPDHLDLHSTMEAYKQAKLLLFDGRCRQVVANADDPVSADIAALMPEATTTYGLDETGADFRATDLRVDATGTRFWLHHDGRRHEARVPIPGRWAVYNALAALATCHRLGHDLDDAVAALAVLPAIPGRFQTVQTPAGVTVVVDYAHSPDSLENILTTIRGFAPGKVITVFGCGGDRDSSKRAPMGQIAAKHSDLVMVTSDNPRTEDPEAIIDQIMAGVRDGGACAERITDRRQAIARALQAAEAGDIVLLAGKGAEPYQVIGERKIPFDDMATVRDLAGMSLLP